MILFFFILFFIGVIIYSASQKAKKAAAALEHAKQEYLSILAKLSEDPVNTQLKQDCLLKGRIYANLTRSNKGVTVFDEVALSNDLSAACASASANFTGVQSDVQVTRLGNISDTTQAPPLAERLARLEQLMKSGLISEAEYLGKRTELLKEI